MQSNEDRKYFLKREAQERRAADIAEKGAKIVHTELADRYAKLSLPTRGKRARLRTG